MTRDAMLADLYGRLTSRKLILAVLSIAFAWWNFSEARLTALEFQGIVFAAVTAYSATDAISGWRSKPSGPEQTVTVEAASAPAPIVTPELVTAMTDELLSRQRAEKQAAVEAASLITQPPHWLPKAPHG